MRLFLILFLSINLFSQEGKYSHSDYFGDYEGTKTCLECHQKEAESFFYSQHYQWKGLAPDLINYKGEKLGKINVINDFCTNPKGCWLGIFKSEKGVTIAKGCAVCHSGFGEIPEEKISQKQLENIDCLICHASGYRRDVYEEGGKYVIKPILWKNKEGLNSVAKRISLPKRDMCLRCHAGSGGGINWKRGDIEPILSNPPKDYDVHMGSGMECIDCHKGKDHRILGRGADIVSSDRVGDKLECSSCHGKKMHPMDILNKHTERVACVTCHIPEFAREVETDMLRDWRKLVLNEENGKYEPEIEFQKNVKPVYKWWNGKTITSSILGEPVKLLNGKIQIMVPDGSIEDQRSKIYPFKYHKAYMPIEEETNFMLPIKCVDAFTTGDILKAINSGTEQYFNRKPKKFRWFETERYMGIFHSIPPKEKALGCFDCHGKGGNFDFKSLGYKDDPLKKLLE